jgi:hypothetical protein
MSASFHQCYKKIYGGGGRGVMLELLFLMLSCHVYWRDLIDYGEI